MAGPINVWADKVRWGLIANPPGTLVAHRKSIIVDVEFSNETASDGEWFYVYDAFNDGDLSGPLDKAYIGGELRVGRFGSYQVEDWGTDVKGDKDFEERYQREKLRVIRYHIRAILVPASTGGADDHFTVDERGNITGFKDETLNIDDASYPEGMQMIRDAVGISHMLNESAKSYGVYRPQFAFDLSLCRSYDRGCKSINKNADLILWAQVEDYIGYLTDPKPEDESKQLKMLQSVLKTAPKALKKLIAE